ncbi:MAG TPA: HEAT repeat domain-containing protein [Planctomycetota bacterium]|nr:HEAT repeat domain-containing protein [Planctomycetota bacterium]
MMLLALTVALLAGPQDDPAVLYREGLYEEIDQGNLEKAMDLYGRLLKGNAEASVKARAFYRRGACLEKMGKKTEAEQVYRDVQERFPEQAEILKLARGRLAALSSNGRAQGFSPETEIQQLILDLGSRDSGSDANNTIREKAIQRLTLIGEAAVPELKRALGHKDTVLAVGAARVLVGLERPEGAYDVFLRSPFDYRDMSSFGKLLTLSEEDRKRFCRDSDRVPPYSLQRILVAVSPPLRDAQLRKSIEDRLLNNNPKAGSDANYLAYSWWSVSEAEQVAALVRRFSRESGKLQYDKIRSLLYARPEPGTFKVPPELAAELLELSKSQDIPNFLDWMRLLSPFVPTKDIIHSVLTSWLKGENADRALLAAQLLADPHGADGFPELPDFVCDALVSKDYRDDVKRALCNALLHWAGAKVDQEPRKSKLQQYLLDYLRKLPPKPAQKTDDVANWGQEFLMETLPTEDAEWEMLLDLDMNRDLLGISIVLDRRIRASERLRRLYVQAATRALLHESPNVVAHAIRQLGSFITPPEERALAKILPRVPSDILAEVVQKLMHGFAALGVEERKAESPSLAPLFKSENPRLREQIVGQFKSFTDGSVDGFMKDALDDADPAIRRNALEFWIARRSPEGIPILIRALRDPDVTIKDKAIKALGRTPSLDSVPPLLEFLRSSNNELRSDAQVALKQIQQYYDEQDQWQKWYEDMKKRAPKDK